MNLTEYRERISEITAKADEEKLLVAKEYALSNNHLKIGDVAEDRSGMISVESVRVYLSDPPQCVYTGRALTKLGKPRKNGEIRNVSQQNLITTSNAHGKENGE